MGLIVVTLFEANRIRGCKQNFFKMIFQRAILDFAAKSELDQSDTSFGDVIVLNKRKKWRPCLLWISFCKIMSDFADKLAFPRPVSAKEKGKHQLYSPFVR